ncbi:hypothetical protein DM819_15225 [Pseudomonas hunanensis]|uniref:Prophage PssSM-03 n=1 Tax=Pseudomonas hunanensis TaxID=1247546 RepID=A0ABD6MZZ0_9PSED|nr:hypothetical protein [Pseudomonas hunanensis]NWL47166.1 hypothetical protein [Pseudomonas hunanensis]
MTRKSHGPSFKKHMIKLAECPDCQGRGVVQGVFHELACDACSSSGWIDRWLGQPLPLQELAAQLGMNLRAALKKIQQLESVRAAGPEAQYQEGNRLGAGGTNYTGD